MLQQKIVLRFKAPQPVPVPDAKDPDTPLPRAPKTEDGFQDTEESRMPLGSLKVEVEEVRLEEGVKIKSEDNDLNCIPQCVPCCLYLRLTSLASIL